MADYMRALKVDENETQKTIKSMQIKKIGVTANEVKRPALGELGNRAVPRRNSGKDKQKENPIKETKCEINLKNAKPRVDTHWRNGPKLIPTTKPKILTRTDSIKSVTSTLRNLPTAQVNKIKTITVKAVKNDNKLTKEVENNKLIEKPQLVAIRREDSKLSQRSLSKLRSTLSKDPKKEIKIIEKCVTKKVSIEKDDVLKKTTKTITNSGKLLNEIEKITISKCLTRSESRKSQDIATKSIEIESHSMKLLNQVENIDAYDLGNPILVPEYVNDIYAYLFHLEEVHSIDEDHLKSQIEVTARMRSVLIDWINEVHYQFHLVPETFHMTVGIIDRYLQAVPDTARQHLQLVGVTALFTAAKYEELYPPEIGDFVYITDHTYDKGQILEMEKRILKKLNFHLERPIPLHFLRRFSKAADPTDNQYLLSKYLIELCSIEYSLAHYKPSEIAAASIFLSMQLLQNPKEPVVTADEIWTPTLEFYTSYSIEHLKPIVKKIAQILRNASNAKLKAVYNKYQLSKFGKISLRSELTSGLIEKICSE